MVIYCIFCLSARTGLCECLSHISAMLLSGAQLDQLIPCVFCRMSLIIQCCLNDRIKNEQGRLLYLFLEWLLNHILVKQWSDYLSRCWKNIKNIFHLRQQVIENMNIFHYCKWAWFDGVHSTSTLIVSDFLVQIFI